MTRDRDEEGKYDQSFADSDFLNAVESVPVASTQNVADEVGCSYDLAYRRLKQLFDDDEIEREEVGGSFVYYIP
jgi:CTP-dependent riboflavin kinase